MTLHLTFDKGYIVPFALPDPIGVKIGVRLKMKKASKLWEPSFIYIKSTK